MSPIPTASSSVRDAFRQGLASGLRSERTPAALGSVPRRLNSSELLDGGREVEIEHAGAVYRLRHTSQGKLILTK